MDNDPRRLFITGCYRSGTTVVEKILNLHPRATVASQPFPIFFFLVKDRFLSALRLERRYPLDHLFLEDGYTGEDFRAFLDAFILTAADLERFWEDMAGYTKGLWTPEMMQFWGKIKPGAVWEVYCQLQAAILSLFPQPGVRYIGSKEILTEEYIPWLLSRGVKVINVIRDPRGMIASLNFRDRDNLTGDNRPVLYSLRAWRKSVAFSLGYEDHPGFFWLKYEDLVAHPATLLKKMTDFLGLDEFASDAFKEGIFDQWGKLWKGNSSFEDRLGISDASLYKFRKALPANVKAFVESCCHAEMSALGYDFEMGGGFNEKSILEYRDPFPSIHAKFPADYSSHPARQKMEIQRWRLLNSGQSVSEEDARRWFIHERAFQRLKMKN